MLEVMLIQLLTHIIHQVLEVVLVLVSVVVVVGRQPLLPWAVWGGPAPWLQQQAWVYWGPGGALLLLGLGGGLLLP